MESQVALDKLRKLCSGHEKCSGEVRNLLKNWDVDERQHDAVIDRLKSEKFIDDRRFAIAYARDKFRFDHWGFIKIAWSLRRKEIPDTLIREAHEAIDRAEYEKMIRQELEKKKKALKGKPYEIWARLARYGSSRGYEMEFMRPVLGDNGPEE